MEPPMSQPKSSFACVRCAERKVKCNKENPCSACTGHKVQCVYRPPKPPRRRRNLAKTEVLQERLRHYEGLLKEKGIDPTQPSNETQTQQPRKTSRSEVSEYVWQPIAPAEDKPQETVFQPLLLHGREGTRFVDNLWSRVVEEIQDPEGTPEEDLNYPSDSEIPNNDFSYVLNSGSSTLRLSHPTTEQIRQLWLVFTENINPLLKIVHVPTLQPAIEKAAANVHHVPAGFEALMFAIYSLAVVSLTEDECQDLLQEDRATAISVYVAATKAALSRAKFMSSTSIVVLQALVLHIISIRDSHDPRAVWSLTGVALRIAECMGMRVDGSLLGLSPFETEIRRRVWWQIKMHNFRCAELAGQSKFRDLDDDETVPKKPANVNDSDLYPKMTEIPPDSTKPTEMMWCALRSDLATFAQTQMLKMRKQGKAKLTSEDYSALDDLKLKDGWIKEMEDKIETKYLRFCDPCQPLHFMTLIGARHAFNLMRFIAHHPRRWAKMNHVPAVEQEFVWNTVIQLLEQYNMMQSNPQLQRFSWNVSYFIQWHAVIHVFDVLRSDPLRSDAARAWKLIDVLYQNNSEMLLSINKPIVAAVGNICLKAFRAREDALAAQGISSSNPPEYITKLRESREGARAKTKQMIATSKTLQIPNNEPEITGAAANVAWPETNPKPPEIPGEFLQQLQPEYLPPRSILTEDDAFWLNDALDSNVFAGETIDMMDLDMNSLLTEDFWLEASNGEGIDWAQFDARLGNIDPMNPSMSMGR